MKEKIEKEITSINELYDKISNEIEHIYKERYESLTKNYNNEYENLTKIYEEECKKIKNIYEENCDKLIKEENTLKESLENKVTQTKEQLENYLNDSNNIIKANEWINKGLKSLKKKNENEKNIIQNLTYFSKINKNKKELIKVIQKPMKNVKIFYETEKADIRYEEYNFNSFPIPYNISFIYNGNWNVKWELKSDFEINRSDIIYKVEISDSKEETYINVYEGNNNFCVLENIDEKKKFNFRICLLFNGIIGDWVYIRDINPLNIFNTESIILSKCNEKIIYLKKLLEWSEYKMMGLVYRASRDGGTSQSFHKRSDYQGPIIVLYQNDKGHIFGGFTSSSWKNDNDRIKDTKSFLFSLTNMYNIVPAKFPAKDFCNIKYYSNKGPSFGYYPKDVETRNDILIEEDFLKKESYSNFPICYDDVLKLGNCIFTSNEKSSRFQIIEMEVFKLF